MKKIISFVLILATVLGMLSFSGCDGEKTPSSTETLTFEAGSATEGTGGPFSPEDHPILKGGVDENFPEHLPGLDQLGAMTGETMQIYGDLVICGFQYYLLSDPDQKLHPIFFEGTPNLFAEENPEVTEWYGNLVSFYLDEELTRQNGGVPVIHYYVEAKFTPPDPIPRASVKKWFFFTFDVKKQEVIFLRGEGFLKTEEGKALELPVTQRMAVRAGYVYFWATVEEEKYFVSMKNDGSGMTLIPMHTKSYPGDKESKPSYFVKIYDGRIWLVQDGVLYSANPDYSELKKETELPSDLADDLKSVHGGYLYFAKETGRAPYAPGWEPFPVRAYVRRPLANPSAEETLVTGIAALLYAEGENLLYAKVDEAVIMQNKVVSYQKLYHYDSESGRETVLYTQKEGDARAIFIRVLSSQWAIVDFNGYAGSGAGGFGKERFERVLYYFATGEQRVLRTFPRDTNVREHNLAYLLDYAEK